jgi:hypothetical protein
MMKAFQSPVTWYERMTGMAGLGFLHPIGAALFFLAAPAFAMNYWH